MAVLSKGDFKEIIPGAGGALFHRNEVRLTSIIYLFLDNENGKCMLVDTGDGKDSFSFVPDAVFLTHGHYDHVGGVKKDWAHVYIHPAEKPTSRFATIPANAQPLPSTSFDFGKFHFEAIHTPGHTTGSMCLFETNHSILLSGDTLFAGGGQGRTDLGGDGAQERMEESLEILSRLDWKVLCPGHGELELR